MTKLSELIKALIENPEDLSQLPTLLDKAVEVEKQEGEYQMLVDKLQATNRNLLKMIPQPQAEPKKEEPKVEEYTLDTGVKSMMTLMEGE